MKLLITGGAGFIGSNFIRYILRRYQDYQVLNFDKLTYAGNLDNLREVEADSRYKFVKGDIADEKFVDEVFKNEAKAFDAVINFAAESISKDTYLPVWCAGRIKILTLDELFGSLSKNKNNKIAEKDGVEVINLNNSNHKALAYRGGIGYWMPIKQISRHKYKGKLIKLSQKWGEIEATPNHSIYDADFNLTTPLKNPELLGLRNINHVCKRDTYLDFNGERLFALMRIFGAYVSEGWTSYNKNNGSFHFGIANADKKWIFDLKDDLKFLGFNPNVTITKDGLFQLIISNKLFYFFVRKHSGFGSHGKFMPSFIFQLKQEFQEEFLKTMIFGDGEIIKNKHYNTARYTTVSKKLATGLSLLVSLLKYNYTICLDERSNAYTFRLGGDFTISLLTKKKKEIDYDDYVYDISVDRLKNFVCGVGNIVVHNTHVDRSITGPKEFIMTDVLGTYTLLEAVKRYKIKKYIQISTDEVYGSTEDGSFSEDSPFMPNSPYSASKAGADHLCRAYNVTYGLPIIVTHSCNVYGPYQYPEKVIPLFITNLLQGKKVPVYGDGKNVREWIFTEDYCSAADTILHKGVAGKVYNIGSGHGIENIELTKRILKELGQGNEMIEYVEDRLGHDRRYSINFDKLQEELGWMPQFSLDEGLKKTIAWYKENEEWWRKLLGKRKN